MDFFGPEKTAEPEVKAEVKVEEKPVAEVKVEQKTTEKIESKQEEKPSPKTETEEKEPEDDLPGNSDKELRSLVRGLRAKVDDAHGRLISATGQPQKTETVVDAKTEKKIEQKVEAEVINFMKDFNMEELIDDPESLNKLLVNVYNRARTDAETMAVEKGLRSIPQLVVNYASRHVQWLRWLENSKTRSRISLQ